MSPSQLFAFADSPVVIGRDNKPVTLFAYADTTNPKPAKKSGGSVTSKAKPKEKDKDTRLQVQVNIANGTTVDILGNFEIRFQTPLKYFDTSQVKFTDDKFNPITGYHLVEDTDAKRIVLDYKLTPGATYKLIATKDFAEDTLGKKLLKTDTISFRAREEFEYGSLKIRFSNLDLSKNPVLQFGTK